MKHEEQIRALGVRMGVIEGCISLIEGRLAALENRPIATLEVTKPRKEVHRHERSPEEKAEKVRQLRAGKAAAKARREAEAQAKVDEPAPVADTPTIVLAKDRLEAEARAKADAEADMKAEADRVAVEA